MEYHCLERSHSLSWSCRESPAPPALWYWRRCGPKIKRHRGQTPQPSRRQQLRGTFVLHHNDGKLMGFLCSLGPPVGSVVGVFWDLSSFQWFTDQKFSNFHVNSSDTFDSMNNNATWAAEQTALYTSNHSGASLLSSLTCAILNPTIPKVCCLPPWLGPSCSGVWQIIRVS